jgi:hypothetical protein
MANINLNDSSNIKVVQSGSDIRLDFTSGGQVATNTSAIGTLANLNTTDKSNLVNAINEVNSFKIAYGTTGLVSHSGNGYKDTGIDFSSAGFTSNPVVIAGLQGNSTGAVNGSGIVAVVASSLTTSGCTLRYYNNSSSSPANYINWIAIGV